MNKSCQALDAARDRLIKRIRSTPDKPFLRLREPLDEAPDLLAWLEAQRHRIRGYWQDRDGRVTVAALGEAFEVKGDEPGNYADCIGRIRAMLTEAEADAKFFGGFRFGRWHRSDPLWETFQAYRFILPLVELVLREDGSAELICNIAASDRERQREEILTVLATLAAPRAQDAGAVLPRVVRRSDAPDRDGWQQMVRTALREIDDGRLEKIVLARRVLLELSGPADPFALIRRIREESGRCYLYAGVHDVGLAFIGASPERLFLRAGRFVRTEALAGTRPRGRTEDEDQDLARSLMTDPKERDEHRLVVEGILRSLEDMTDQLRFAERPSILKLANVQHLHTSIDASLSEPYGDADLLRVMHPTPALGGKPMSRVAEMIVDLEPFDRGWYAGPIGWVSRDAAEFAVAIRCGLVAGPRVYLFSGAGIVAGSDPDAEWNEMEAKLSSFLRLWAQSL